jgi:hypothetical protein
LSYADFVRPVQTAVMMHFLISTVFGRYMVTQGSGVILAMAGGPRGCAESRRFARGLVSAGRAVSPVGVRIGSVGGTGCLGPLAGIPWVGR